MESGGYVLKSHLIFIFVAIAVTGCAARRSQPIAGPFLSTEVVQIIPTDLLSKKNDIPDRLLVEAAVYADILTRLYKSPGDRKFSGAFFMKLDANDAEYFVIPNHRFEPRIEKGLSNSRRDRNGDIFDKISGKPGLIITLSIKRLNDGQAEVSAATTHGPMGTVFIVYKLFLKEGSWQIGEHRVTGAT